MYDNVPDPFDRSMPSTSRDVGVMPINIKNSTNVDTSVVDNLDDNNKIHQSINTTIDKISNIDKSMNIGSGNTNKVNNNNNENNNETKPKKIEINNKKEKFYNVTHPLKLKKCQSFSQTFINVLVITLCDKIINSNTEQIKTVIESNNKMIMLIMEKEKETLQQTQLFLQQLNTCQSSYTAPYSFSAFNFPTNFVDQPRFQQFRNLVYHNYKQYQIDHLNL